MGISQGSLIFDEKVYVRKILGDKLGEKKRKEEKEELGFLEEAKLQGFIAGSLLILWFDPSTLIP